MSAHDDYLDPDRFLPGSEMPEHVAMFHEAVKRMCEDLGGSPWDFYRAVYKGTACGPSIGMRIDEQWVYCDKLPGEVKPQWWTEHYVDGLSVSSIVEGSAAEVPAQRFEASDLTDEEQNLDEGEMFRLVNKWFFNAVEDVNIEACMLWERDNRL